MLRPTSWPQTEQNFIGEKSESVVRVYHRGRGSRQRGNGSWRWLITVAGRAGGFFRLVVRLPAVAVAAGMPVLLAMPGVPPTLRCRPGLMADGGGKLGVE